jgi:hypothetical protein
MSAISATLTMEIMIHDVDRLWRDARECAEEWGFERSEYITLIGTEDDPDISGCIQMLCDPGIDPDGCEVENSYVEFAGTDA